MTSLPGKLAYVDTCPISKRVVSRGAVYHTMWLFPGDAVLYNFLGVEGAANGAFIILLCYLSMFAFAGYLLFRQIRSCFQSKHKMNGDVIVNGDDTITRENKLSIPEIADEVDIKQSIGQSTTESAIQTVSGPIPIAIRRRARKALKKAIEKATKASAQRDESAQHMEHLAALLRQINIYQCAASEKIEFLEKDRDEIERKLEEVLKEYTDSSADLHQQLNKAGNELKAATDDIKRLTQERAEIETKLVGELNARCREIDILTKVKDDMESHINNITKTLNDGEARCREATSKFEKAMADAKAADEKMAALLDRAETAEHRVEKAMADYQELKDVAARSEAYLADVKGQLQLTTEKLARSDAALKTAEDAAINAETLVHQFKTRWNNFVAGIDIAVGKTTTNEDKSFESSGSILADATTADSIVDHVEDPFTKILKKVESVMNQATVLQTKLTEAEKRSAEAIDSCTNTETLWKEAVKSSTTTIYEILQELDAVSATRDAKIRKVRKSVEVCRGEVKEESEELAEEGHVRVAGGIKMEKDVDVREGLTSALSKLRETLARIGKENVEQSVDIAVKDGRIQRMKAAAAASEKKLKKELKAARQQSTLLKQQAAESNANHLATTKATTDAKAAVEKKLSEMQAAVVAKHAEIGELRMMLESSETLRAQQAQRAQQAEDKMALLKKQAAELAGKHLSTAKTTSEAKAAAERKLSEVEKQMQETMMAKDTEFGELRKRLQASEMLVAQRAQQAQDNMAAKDKEIDELKARLAQSEAKHARETVDLKDQSEISRLTHEVAKLKQDLATATSFQQELSDVNSESTDTESIFQQKLAQAPKIRLEDQAKIERGIVERRNLKALLERERKLTEQKGVDVEANEAKPVPTSTEISKSSDNASTDDISPVNVTKFAAAKPKN
ncbi:hypothetical protein HDU76_006897 [Blyttiomyces sp. JEL0837]|nr:hypothetical protein HDU76_006897 [Blyttiomyces sp. JEL0837]